MDYLDLFYAFPPSEINARINKYLGLNQNADISDQLEAIAKKYKDGFLLSNDWDIVLVMNHINAAHNAVNDQRLLMDFDKDGWSNSNDNCPDTHNADQADENQNDIGDVCESPQVTTFQISPTGVTTGNPITASYTVTDSKGIDHVELWRAIDSNGEPSDWELIAFEQVTEPLTSYSGVFTDNPTHGTWWYGFHVVDSDDNCTTERNEDCTTGESNGGNVIGPIKVKAADYYSIITQLFWPDSIDLGMGYDDSVEEITVTGNYNPVISDHGVSISVTLSGYTETNDVIGEDYEFTIHFKDGTIVVQTYTIENLNTNFVWMVSPADGEAVTSITPILEWDYVEAAASTHIVVSDSSGIIWWSDNFSSGITSTEYNSNGNATANLEFGNQYWIQINSYDVNWNQATTWSSFRVEEPCIISAPAGLSATYDEVNYWILITWDDDHCADSYDLYWGTESGVTKTSEYAGPTNETVFTHTGVVPGQTYYYRVAAVKADMESELSIEDSALVPYPLFDLSGSVWLIEYDIGCNEYYTIPRTWEFHSNGSVTCNECQYSASWETIDNQVFIRWPNGMGGSTLFTGTANSSMTEILGTYWDVNDRCWRGTRQ